MPKMNFFQAHRRILGDDGGIGEHDRGIGEHDKGVGKNGEHTKKKSKP
jgi:hypothetical protein